ncbi:hypothetical protein NKH77_04885 [Streptomyces sp. M19]
MRFEPGGEGWAGFTTRIPCATWCPARAARRRRARDLDHGQQRLADHVPRRGPQGPIYRSWPRRWTTATTRCRPLQTPEQDREVVVHRNGAGYVVLFERATLPMLRTFAWREDGGLELDGRYAALDRLSSLDYASCHLVVRSRAHGAERRVPWSGTAPASAPCSPRVPAHPRRGHPLAAGRWDFYLRRQDPSTVAPEAPWRT